MTDSPPAGLAALVRDGVLDAELGGLLWALAEGGLAVVVAGASAADRARIVDAVRAVRADDTGLVVELVAADDPDPRSTARTFLAAAQAGLGPLGGMTTSDLEGVFAALERRPVRLSRDELGQLGVVVVLEPAALGGGDRAGTGAPVRVAACHWVRPLARDAHGHVQRLGPAVLATWDPGLGDWAHFAWGVMPELAARLGRRAGDLDRDVGERTARLAAMAAGQA